MRHPTSSFFLQGLKQNLPVKRPTHVVSPRQRLQSVLTKLICFSYKYESIVLNHENLRKNKDERADENK